MALETAISQQDFFCHNNGTNNNTNNNNNKDIYPLLLEAWPDNIIGNDSFFHPCLKLQDPHHFDNSSTLDYYNTTSTYFLDNQLEFDWNSYYNHHGINNHDDNNNNNNTSIIPSLTFPDCTINHDLPPLNNYDYDCWGLLNNSSPEEVSQAPNNEGCVAMELAPRPKQRRRARAKKNQEEIENQRMTHIAVERNRRKQMNDYLNEIRSLMPDSYVQRGDQASIVGAAINFVKELEHNLQNLSAKKQMKENLQTNNPATSSTSSLLLFEDFFTFPQFSSISNNNGEKDDNQMKPGLDISCHQQLDHAGVQGGGDGGGGGDLGVDVEVTMVESHAHLKIRLRRSLKHLSKLVAGLHSLRLLILHLNVNTADDGVVLYSFSLKVEDETKLNSVDEIARAVYLLLGRIQEETNS